MSNIKDISLSEIGVSRIEWAAHEMPVVKESLKQFKITKPLEGVKISGCLHITTETAVLARALKAAGADLVLCASNPLSTQDDVAAALVSKYGIPVYAIHGEDTTLYYQHIQAALNHNPVMTLDDGADLITELHKTRTDLLDNMIGGTEETTTGVIRLRAMEKDKALKYPVMAVNDAMTKYLFDNRYGTGQSALDGIIRATNILLAGKTFTVVGYGLCGRGVALRAKGHGANVIVTEVDPLRALEACMDGYRVMSLIEAVKESDFIITVTGNKHVVDQYHLEEMKDGCILANAGHFNVEINIPALESMSVESSTPRVSVKEYTLKDGRIIRLLAEGRLVNLAAAEGHPSAVMDMSFANQILSVIYMYKNYGQLKNTVYKIPADIDHEIAQLKLDAMGIVIDQYTDQQKNYLSSWKNGT